MESKKIAFIRQNSDPIAMHLQLAEEAVELSNALIKYVRVIEGVNPTPVTYEEAKAKVLEEFTDLCLVADVIRLEPNKGIRDYKTDRWCNRLAEHKDIPLPNWDEEEK